MNKTFRKNLLKQLLIAFVVLAVLFAGLFFVRSHIKESVAQIMSTRQELANRTATLNALSDLRSQYNDFGKSYLNVLANIVPEKDQLINISQDFETIARNQDLGFGFSFVNESTPDGDSGLGHIQFRLNITADKMNEVESFIENLKNFKYLTTVDSVNINRNNDEGIIELSLNGKVYFQ